VIRIPGDIIMRTFSFIPFTFLVVSLGCTFIARGPDEYRSDTRDLLETRNMAVKSCYDQALEQNSSLSGQVTVNFTVEKKTGLVKNVTVDEGRSTAPESLSSCITDAIEGIKLTPEDQRDGLATYTYVFQVSGDAPV
jgi:hypothetical protein